MVEVLKGLKNISILNQLKAFQAFSKDLAELFVVYEDV